MLHYPISFTYCIRHYMGCIGKRHRMRERFCLFFLIFTLSVKQMSKMDVFMFNEWCQLFIHDVIQLVRSNAQITSTIQNKQKN